MVVARGRREILLRVGDKNVEEVSDFKYLDTIISEDGRVEADIDHKVIMANRFYYFLN